jgi:hypothetical protein
MDDALFMKLPLADRAEFVKKNGNFVEAQDYYSYQVFQYSLERHTVELLYDFDHNLINVEFTEAKHPSDFLTKQIEYNIGDPSESPE